MCHIVHFEFTVVLVVVIVVEVVVVVVVVVVVASEIFNLKKNPLVTFFDFYFRSFNSFIIC